MKFYADLHIHSKYSLATSRDCDLEHLELWAKKKGIRLLGTGDFTHPAWFAELENKLAEAEPGLYRLSGSAEAVRFVLQCEISTIYKKEGRTRKVHHLIYFADLQAVRRFRRKLERVGNINSDGRPILGLDSRSLFEMALESSSEAFLIPAHIWTPWFSALGAQSGFDSIDACYEDLSQYIFAVETGLSSDPPMNWRVSQLDRFRLVSNSDAHSPQKLGREACIFDADLSFFGVRDALQTGKGYSGTIEFFPEEGKYHLDGHRKCGVRLSPDESRRINGICPACGGKMTLGVLGRIAELADRAPGAKPESAGRFSHLVPLAEVLSQTDKRAPASKAIGRAYDELTAALGPELVILEELPIEDIAACHPGAAQAIGKIRRGDVVCQGGYDGQYGVVKI